MFQNRTVVTFQNSRLYHVCSTNEHGDSTPPPPPPPPPEKVNITKQAHSSILKTSPPKIESFQIKAF